MNLFTHVIFKRYLIFVYANVYEWMPVYVDFFVFRPRRRRCRTDVRNKYITPPYPEFFSYTAFCAAP